MAAGCNAYRSSIIRIPLIHICAVDMSKKFKDLNSSDLSKLPSLMDNHFCIGEERIYLHLWNRKNMHWYISEYDRINQRFFGFYENKSDGISSGLCNIKDIHAYSRKGEAWEPIVDEAWKPVAAKEIASLQGYINMMRCPPDW
jgi:hypothetical protein